MTVKAVIDGSSLGVGRGLSEQECVLFRNEDMGWSSQHPLKMPGLVTPVCNCQHKIRVVRVRLLWRQDPLAIQSTLNGSNSIRYPFLI